MKRLFRWAFYALIALVVLCVAGILLVDNIASQVATAHIRNTTGMDVSFGKLSVGLASPTITIQDLKLYNSAEFGGSPCLSIPDLYIEYDPAAMKSRQLHLKLVRVNIAEISIVKNNTGKLNFGPWIGQPSAQGDGSKGESGNEGKSAATPAGMFEFTGLDTLNLTLRKARVSRLDSPSRYKEVDFQITNQIFHNLKSKKDLAPLAVVLAGKGGMELWTEISPNAADFWRRQKQNLKTLFNGLVPAK